MIGENPRGVIPIRDSGEIVERTRDRRWADRWNIDKGRGAVAWSFCLIASVALTVGSAVIASGGDASTTAEGQQPPPAAVLKHQPPPDGTWTADAEVTEARTFTTRVWVRQGVAVHDNRVYVYGDDYNASPRVGVIREYDLNLSPTGREVRLSRDGKPLIIHPTGLTWDARLAPSWAIRSSRRRSSTASTGNAPDRQDPRSRGARRHRRRCGHQRLPAPLREPRRARFDCHRRLRRRPPRATTLRPEVMLKAGRPALRASSSARCSAARSTRTSTGMQGRGRMICVQNVIEGRGWRLDVLNLDRAIADGRASGPGVRLRTFTFAPHDELEG